MIKLICLDIDGTLLNSNHEVPVENLDSIRRATEKGVYVTIATGRMFPSARFFGKKVGINAPIVTMNGSYVKDEKNNEIIVDERLSRYEVRKLVEILGKFGLKPYFYSDDTMFVSDGAERYRKINSQIPENERYKIVDFTDDFTYENLIDEFGDQLYKCIVFPKVVDKPSIKRNVLNELDISVVESDISNYEFTNKRATKGNAIAKLANHLGISEDEVMTVGDSENDFSMIERFKNSVAMGNASDLIKNTAGHMTKTNDECGVSHIIERMVLKNEN